MGKDSRNEMTEGSLQPESGALQLEIQQTEARMSETLRCIEERLSPARLKEQAAESALRWAAQAVNTISSTVSRNKVGFSVLGVALVLLAGRRVKHARKPEVIREKHRRQRLETLAKAIAAGAKPSHGAGLFSKGIAIAFGTAIGTLLSQTRSREAALR